MGNSCCADAKGGQEAHIGDGQNGNQFHMESGIGANNEDRFHNESKGQANPVPFKFLQKNH